MKSAIRQVGDLLPKISPSDFVIATDFEVRAEGAFGLIRMVMPYASGDRIKSKSDGLGFSSPCN